jgi:hypothetical protein
MFRKELYFHYGVALVETGDVEGGQLQLEMAIEPAEQVKDPRRLVDIRSQLGELALRSQDKVTAKVHFEKALEAAERGKLVEQGKRLKIRLAEVAV